MNIPDPTPITDLIESFRRSKTMFAAVSLGIFDYLALGPDAADNIAVSMNVEADALERLLDACVGLGLLRREIAGYANEPLAETYLCRRSARTLAGYILYSNDVLFPMWANLEDAVREGSHRWKQTFGLDGSIFSHFFRSEEALRLFLMGMHGFGLLSSPKVVAAFDLSRFQRLADLGGATGHLAIAACELHPNLRAVVFDLPRTIELASEEVERSHASDRIEIVGGDFFTDRLPEADLYALGRILHDWSEEKIHRLLGKICEALPSGGALLIAEKLLEPDKSGPVAAHMQSLNMLICTEGKERTLDEYTALLREAGFSEIEGRQTGAPVDAVLAVKR